MAEQEADVIGHLLEIERSASEVLAQAHDEADKRISAARAKADQDFKAQYDAIVAAEEKKYAEQTAQITKDYDAEVAAYKSRIGAAQKDVPAFNKLLDNVLFAN